MKKSILLIVFLAAISIANVAFAQAPQGMNYQAVARDASGAILANQHISLQFTITDFNAGPTLYQETDTAYTNQFGLFTVNIGSGTPVSGTFSLIDWANVTAWLQVDFDPAGGTSYVPMGTSQLLSVPYALSAGSTGQWNSNGSNIYNANSGFVGIGTTTPSDPLTLVTGSGIGLNHTDGIVSLSTYIDGSGGWLGTNSNHALNFYTNYSGIRMTIDTLGNVGIGTGAPAATLEVNGNVRITDGNQAAARVLTSDSNGFANWQVTQTAIAYGVISGTNCYNCFGVDSVGNSSTGNYIIYCNGTLVGNATATCTIWDTSNYGFISYYQSGNNLVGVRIRNSAGVDTDMTFSFVVFGK